MLVAGGGGDGGGGVLVGCGREREVRAQVSSGGHGSPHARQGDQCRLSHSGGGAGVASPV